MLQCCIDLLYLELVIQSQEIPYSYDPFYVENLKAPNILNPRKQRLFGLKI